MLGQVAFSWVLRNSIALSFDSLPSVLTPRTSNPYGRYSSYHLEMIPISDRHWSHDSAQNITSVTFPR